MYKYKFVINTILQRTKNPNPHHPRQISSSSQSNQWKSRPQNFNRNVAKINKSSEAIIHKRVLYNILPTKMPIKDRKQLLEE